MRTDQPARRSPAARIVAWAVVGLLAVATAGCATNPSQDELAEALERSGLSEPVAACAAEAIESTLSDAELETLVARGSGGLPTDDPNRSDDAADELRAAVSACRSAGIDEASTTTGVAPGGRGRSEEDTTTSGG